jgi:hypothetical protein
MPRFRITRRNPEANFGVQSGALHEFQLAPLAGEVLEMEDVHFNLDSAVMLPGPGDPTDAEPSRRVEGLAVLVAALAHAERNPEKKLLVTGHADTSGDEAYNVRLSQQRADGVVAALLGDETAWVDLALAKHKVHDYQQILQLVAWLWGWPCDPGPIDGDHGSGTNAAVKAFQRLAGAELQRTLSVDGDVGRQTWGAFFEVYMRILADLMGIDRAELTARQGQLVWVDDNRRGVGCGESFPIEERGNHNYRSATNRRVELVFFDPGEEPELACHAAAGRCEKDRCDLYSPMSYQVTYLPLTPLSLLPRTMLLSLTEVGGLYKPGHADAEDVGAGTTRASGYLHGYTSDDDAGRIFVNHVPRRNGAVSWQQARRKDVQYIELAVVVSTNDGSPIPAGTRVHWTWEDPDDPSNAAMEANASGLVDPNDSGVPTGNDNLGQHDHPRAGHGTGAKYEGIDSYGLEEIDAHTATTAIVGGQSVVRLHCTNVAGDNYRVTARLAHHQLVQPGVEAPTGLMTMWKRIDLEYRCMDGAHSLPVRDMARFFEPCFVQMDPTEELSTPRLDTLSPTDDAAFDLASSNYVKAPPTGVFQHEYEPGWFLLVAAHRAAANVAAATRTTLFTGPGTFDEIRFNDGSRGERVVIDAPLAQAPVAAKLKEGTNELRVFALAKDADTPAPGKTAIYLSAIDYQSDFVPGNGVLEGPGGSYEHRIFRYPRHEWSVPARTWTTPGLGFPTTVEVEIVGGRGGETGGVSPENHHRGKGYFAGRTIIFTKHPSYNNDDGTPKLDELLHTITHEIGHAFGFPHKCGYPSWQDPPTRACCMNYFHSWLYTPGTRTLQRFVTGEESAHFCARHLHGIRRVHLEDNPAMWRWP